MFTSENLNLGKNSEASKEQKSEVLLMLAFVVIVFYNRSLIKAVFDMCILILGTLIWPAQI